MTENAAREMRATIKMYNRITELKKNRATMTAAAGHIPPHMEPTRRNSILLFDRELEALQRSADEIEKIGGVYLDNGDFVAL